MTIVRQLESEVTDSMKAEGGRFLRARATMNGPQSEKLAAELYAHMEDVRRRNEETAKRRRNYGYDD